MAKNRKIVIENNKAYYEWEIAVKKQNKGDEQKYQKARRLIGDIFIEEGDAIFSDPEMDQKIRKVIVVGIRYKETMAVIPNTPTVNSDGMVIFRYEPPRKHTVLKLGHAITHPNDDYDFEFGVSLAISYAKKSHRSLIATSYSMLATERCENIVKDELEYIQQNLNLYV